MGVLLAVNRKRNAHPVKNSLGFFTPLAHERMGLLRQPLFVALVVRPHGAIEVAHFIEFSVHIVCWVGYNTACNRIK